MAQVALFLPFLRHLFGERGQVLPLDQIATAAIFRLKLAIMNPAPDRLLTLADLPGRLLNAEQDGIVFLQHVSPFHCLQLSRQMSTPHRVKWVDNCKDDPAQVRRTGIAEMVHPLRLPSTCADLGLGLHTHYVTRICTTGALMRWLYKRYVHTGRSLSCSTGWERSA